MHFRTGLLSSGANAPANTKGGVPMPDESTIMPDESTFLQVLSSNIPVEKILTAIVALALCLLARRYLLLAFDRLLHRMPKVAPAMHSILRAIMRILLLLLSVMIALNIIGVPISSFLAVFSVIGLALSLAVQGVLKNFAGGMIILASKPFSLGDYIEAETVAGTVEEISLLYTRLTTPDGRTIYVPNDVLYSSQMINYTYSGTRRIEVPIGVSYDNTPEQVRAAALDAISTLEGTLADPAPAVYLDSYGDSSINYLVQVWVPATNYLSMRYALNERIYDAFQRHGVEITYPHLNVHNIPAPKA